ncbi:MAG: hypothetical protein ACK40Q_00305 [Pseudothermotoga sp.]
MRKVLYLLVIVVVLALGGCLSLLEPNVGKFSEDIVKAINDYLQGNVDVEYLVSRYVHIHESATITDASFHATNLLGFFSQKASEVSLVSYGDTGLKFFSLESPPSWVDKVYTMNLLMKSTQQLQPGSCPMLLIEGKPYLLTVYASGTAIVSYPMLGE